ncbi:hypothetical protein [Variovorax rhizosphaerae]|uniref:Uncharacterized protein n=1 Tax=Variovorax rhizosphaerae TaxID=1836200 RepID=A0ABU8WJR0_9BURK
MPHSLPAVWLAASLAALTLGATAQPAHDPAGPGPAGSARPPLPYVSAFEGYQSFKDEKPIPWREANDTVHRRGGWRAYASEGSAPKAAEGKTQDAYSGMGHAMPMPANKERP